MILFQLLLLLEEVIFLKVYIPGFREKKILNMVIACVYYITALQLFYEGEISVGLAAISLPLMFFSTLDFIKKRQRFFLFPLIISLILFFVAVIIFPEEQLIR